MTLKLSSTRAFHSRARAEKGGNCPAATFLAAAGLPVMARRSGWKRWCRLVVGSPPVSLMGTTRGVFFPE
uniref:Uncharacterized protein n=1 Tax=Arundo donax TaxID=35708 RepID=A0A0A9ATH8_ARUDO